MCNEEKKELELSEVLRYASLLARKVKGFPESQELYIQIFLRIRDDFFISKWTSWEDQRTGEKLLFLVGDNRCVLTDFRNVEKIDFFYEKPKSNAIEFKGPVE